MTRPVLYVAIIYLASALSGATLAAMARKLRIQYPGAGAIHHVMSRGDPRDDIYVSNLPEPGGRTPLSRICSSRWRMKVDAMWQQGKPFLKDFGRIPVRDAIS